MEAIAFKGEKVDPDAYVPYKPAVLLAIEEGKRPPILQQFDHDSVYEIDSIKVEVFMEVREPHGLWKMKTPFALARYFDVPGAELYDDSTVNEAIKQNMVHTAHNGFIIDTIRAFMKRHDCGVSGKMITLPEPAPDLRRKQAEYHTHLFADPLETTRKAIEFLAENGKYCGRDYKFADAKSEADALSFTLTRDARVGAAARIRVSTSGRRPAWWDGVSDTDSNGRRVKWGYGKNHSFLTPHIQPVAVIEAEEEGKQIALQHQNVFDSIIGTDQKEGTD